MTHGAPRESWCKAGAEDFAVNAGVENLLIGLGQSSGITGDFDVAITQSEQNAEIISIGADLARLNFDTLEWAQADVAEQHPSGGVVLRKLKRSIAYQECV